MATPFDIFSFSAMTATIDPSTKNPVIDTNTQSQQIGELTEWQTFLFMNVLPKIGLLITLLTCVVPFPQIFRGFQDKNAIKSLSKQWYILSSTAASVVCCLSIKMNYFDALLCNIIVLVSNLATLLCMALIQRTIRQFAFLLFFWMALATVLMTIVPVWIIEQLALLASTISACVGPMETLNKLMVTRDEGFLNVPMFFFCGVNAVIWTVYGIAVDSYPVFVANGVGAITIFNTLVAYKYAQGKFEKDSFIMMGPNAMNTSYSFVGGNYVPSDDGDEKLLETGRFETLNCKAAWDGHPHRHSSKKYVVEEAHYDDFYAKV